MRPSTPRRTVSLSTRIRSARAGEARTSHTRAGASPPPRSHSRRQSTPSGTSLLGGTARQWRRSRQRLLAGARGGADGASGAAGGARPADPHPPAASNVVRNRRCCLCSSLSTISGMARATGGPQRSAALRVCLPGHGDRGARRSPTPMTHRPRPWARRHGLEAVHCTVSCRERPLLNGVILLLNRGDSFARRVKE